MELSIKEQQAFSRRWLHQFYKPVNGIWKWVNPDPDEIEKFCKSEIELALASKLGNDEVECTMEYTCKCEDCTKEREFAETYGMDRF